jgi:hypothetical protein
LEQVLLVRGLRPPVPRRLLLLDLLPELPRVQRAARQPAREHRLHLRARTTHLNTTAARRG